MDQEPARLVLRRALSLEDGLQSSKVPWLLASAVLFDATAAGELAPVGRGRSLSLAATATQPPIPSVECSASPVIAQLSSKVREVPGRTLKYWMPVLHDWAVDAVGWEAKTLQSKPVKTSTPYGAITLAKLAGLRLPSLDHYGLADQRAGSLSKRLPPHMQKLTSGLRYWWTLDYSINYR